MYTKYGPNEYEERKETLMSERIRQWWLDHVKIDIRTKGEANEIQYQVQEQLRKINT